MALEQGHLHKINYVNVHLLWRTEAVSYTHLDVYKRQNFIKLRLLSSLCKKKYSDSEAELIFLHGAINYHILMMDLFLI